MTVLSSRTSNRYRLQSDSLPSLWVILKSLSMRLEKYWSSASRSSAEKLVLGHASSLPLQDLFQEIDVHFLKRRKQKELETQLLNRTTQFRVVQRRLLTKFKDKTPTSLTSLDSLLEGTYKQIIQMIDLLNKNSMEMEENACQLSCIVRLLLELIQLQISMSDSQKALLLSVLSPIVHCNMEQGWEEVTDSGVSFVLRNMLGKGLREAGPISSSVAQQSDTSKLKKHIGLFVDKVTKGGVPLELNVTEEEVLSKQELLNIASHDREEFGDENDQTVQGGEQVIPQPVSSQPLDVPLGSRLGEDRARSARIRSARAKSAGSMRQHPPTIGTVEMAEGEEQSAGQNVQLDQVTDDDQKDDLDEDQKDEVGATNDLDQSLQEDSRVASGVEDHTTEVIETDGQLPQENGEVGEAVHPDEELPYLEDMMEREGEEDVLNVKNPPKQFKKAADRDDNLETPEDIFGNPEDGEGW